METESLCWEDTFSLDNVSLSRWAPLRPDVSPGMPGPLSGHLVPPCPALGLASTQVHCFSCFVQRLGRAGKLETLAGLKALPLIMEVKQNENPPPLPRHLNSYIGYDMAKGEILDLFL